LHLYPAPQHVGVAIGTGAGPSGEYGRATASFMQDPANELPRILLLRRWVNNDLYSMVVSRRAGGSQKGSSRLGFAITAG
jgi:hypothetical protein